MGKLFSAVIIHLSFGCYAQLFYPVTEKIPVQDTFYSKVIIDDYRWLEEIDSTKVKAWVEEQNKISKFYLKKAANKINSYPGIDKYSYAEYSNPQKQGDYYFSFGFYNSVGLPALYYRKNYNADPDMLVDPNYISGKDQIFLREYSISKNSQLLAYQYSRNGSDFTEIQVVSLSSETNLKDHLKDVKFSNISWKDDGFFYSRFPNTGIKITQGQEIFYHKIGTEQTEDKLIFRRPDNPDLFFNVQTTDDERYLLIKETNQKTGLTNIFYIDYLSAQKNILPLVTKIQNDLNILDNIGKEFIAISYKGNNNGMIVKVDPAEPRKWKEIVPLYSKAVILEVKLLATKIIAIYQTSGKQQIIVFDLEGKILHSIELPYGFSARGFNGEKEDKELLFSYNSYTTPPVVYIFNGENYSIKPLRATVVNFDYTQFETKELEYASKDGTKVPLFLIYKKGIALDQKNPVLLKSYGGFGIVSRPSFDPGIVHFLIEGGIFAFAHIRGGGDNGKSWAEAGRGIHKQNSFDDFIAAAEFLIVNNYTSSDKLAITGGSNGGLVVGAAMTQRPELFKAVVPIVAPLDMLRFEKFTIGGHHTDEYGNMNDSLGFLNLLSYSPLHNIKDEVNYPATLIMTSENDDRVPPLHSYKYAARLQNRKAQTNPIVLRVEKETGHYGAGANIKRIVKEDADMYDFILYHLKEK